MIKINLLPQELSVNKKTARVVKIIKNLNIIFLIIFIVSGAMLGVFFFLSSQKLARLQAEASEMETQIKSQQTVEQSVVLLKDRLVKIKTLDNSETAEEMLADIRPVIELLPTDAVVGELSIDSKEIDMGVSFPSSLSLGSFFSSLGRIDNFSKIRLANFSFNPATGYLVGFSFQKNANEKS